jgi:hypothetical protein
MKRGFKKWLILCHEMKKMMLQLLKEVDNIDLLHQETNKKRN